jgi:hypothetical protein
MLASREEISKTLESSDFHPRLRLCRAVSFAPPPGRSALAEAGLRFSPTPLTFYVSRLTPGVSRITRHSLTHNS